MKNKQKDTLQDFLFKMFYIPLIIVIITLFFVFIDTIIK